MFALPEAEAVVFPLRSLKPYVAVGNTGLAVSDGAKLVAAFGPGWGFVSPALTRPGQPVTPPMVANTKTAGSAPHCPNRRTIRSPPPRLGRDSTILAII